MKLAGNQVAGYCAKPDATSAGILLYGPEPMRIALLRQSLIKALIGPDGEEEMRLSRIPASDLRKDPAQASDAMKAVSFFPGPRAVFIEEATEALAPAILTALEDWQDGDAQLVVTAGQLKPASKLRKAFEAHPSAKAAAVYDNPPSRDDIERTLKEAGIAVPDRDIMTALSDLALSIEPGDFRQTMEKLALYKRGDDTPVSADDITACAPASTEAELDDILHVVAEGRAQDIAPVLRKLQAQGANPVSLTIAAMRHFRTLHAASCDPGGPASGFNRVRPPVFGPRRDRMQRQAKNWGIHKLESAIGVLTDTDLSLRSAGQTAPAMAVVERAFIRLAMLGQRRN